MTDEQIEKALECCLTAECWGDCEELGCPASTPQGCRYYMRTSDDTEDALDEFYREMIKDALSLIKRKEYKYCPHCGAKMKGGE